MPIPFSPTKGSDHVNTSMKLGSQYGWGEQLNCRMFMTLFSYFKTAAGWGYGNDVGGKKKEVVNVICQQQHTCSTIGDHLRYMYWIECYSISRIVQFNQSCGD